ncbi:alpha/beta-hydrolase [Atractiella rhizophila]|nr:alpha/beta-hydrolase [Atractiella rhizophila]
MISLILTIALVAVTSAAPLVSRPSPPIVHLTTGTFQGTTNSTTRVDWFQGIPYALPPTGARRFKAPQPAAYQSGIRNATSYGFACPQINAVLGSPLPVPIAEDCLTANFYRYSVPPSPVSMPTGVTSSQRLPVLVWIHGGGFYAGVGAAHDPTPIVQRSVAMHKPIIVVSINYRLSSFGFLYNPDVTDPQDVNVGLLDQTYALQFIKSNVAAFGGDPNKITICTENWLFGKGCGVQATTSPRTAYDCLVDTPYDTLASLALNITLGPVIVDNTWLDKSPKSRLATKAYNKVPTIMGTNKDEGATFTLGVDPDTEAETLALMQGSMSAQNAQTLLSIYNTDPYTGNMTWAQKYEEIVGDWLFLGDRRWVSQQLRATQPVYTYHFEQAPPGARNSLGAYHASELEFLFGSWPALGGNPSNPTQLQALQDRMISYWVNFVVSLNPNGDKLCCGVMNSKDLEKQEKTPAIANSTAERQLERRVKLPVQGRYRAKGKRLGSVLCNPGTITPVNQSEIADVSLGGPGAPGKGLATQAGRYIANEVGPDYDVIGFDPRGVGETLPSLACFKTNGLSYTNFVANSPIANGYDVISTSTNAERVLQNQLQQSDQLYSTMFGFCRESLGREGAYMGTTLVVRDMDFITKALDGEDALMSTVILCSGSRLSQELWFHPWTIPDCNVSSSHRPRLTSKFQGSMKDRAKGWLSSTEVAYSRFLGGCMEAGPYRCALASLANSAAGLRLLIDETRRKYYYSPLPIFHPTKPGYLRSGTLDIFLLLMLEIPATWQAHAQALYDLIGQGDGSAVYAASLGFDAALKDLERSGVSCNDQMLGKGRAAEPNSADVAREMSSVLREVSDIGMAMFSTERDQGCGHWPWNPPERFVGPWNVTLRSPILILSNLADPITPVSAGHHSGDDGAAKKLSATLGKSSRLVLQDAPGHSTKSTYSRCTLSIVQRYWRHGELPADGVVCPIDQELFPNPQVPAASVDSEEQAVIEERMKLHEFLVKLRRGSL